MIERGFFFGGVFFGIALWELSLAMARWIVHAFEKKQLRPRFIIYPPGASDEVREACDKLINQTWGSK